MENGYDNEDMEEIEEIEVLEEIDLDDAAMEEASDDGSADEYEPDREDAILIIRKHDSAVFSSAFHPNSPKTVVTGGMDEKAYVWDLDKPESPTKTLDQFQDSIDCIKFNKSGEILVVADLSGTVRIFNAKTYELISHFKLPDVYKWVECTPNSNDVIFGSGNSVCAYRFPFQGDCEYLNYDFSSSQDVGRIFPNGLKLATGLEDGSLQLFNLVTKEVKTVQPFKNHDEKNAITSVDVHPDNVNVVCGCLSGALFHAHAESGKFAFLPSPLGDRENVEMASLKFSRVTKPQNLLAAGNCDGTLRIWDFSRQQIRHQEKFCFSVTHVEWHPTEYLLFIGHLFISVFDAKSGTIIKEFLGHSKSCLSLALSPDASLLLSTAEDNTARVYQVHSQGEPSSS